MLLFFLLVYFFLCFFVPTIRTYRSTGINPITFSKSQNAHDLICLYMKMLILLSLFAGLEALHLFAIRLDLIFHDSRLYFFGLIFMILAILWTVTAQIQMANSWLIGIDESHKTELKTVGLFKFSRNPIFLGMLVFQFGTFLFHPTALLLNILVMSFILITIQVRLEEEFLLKQHGEEYQTFMKSVPRWLIGNELL